MSEDCSTDRSGSRHADQCQVKHGNVGDRWQRTKSKIRKVYVSKPRDAVGQDVCRIYKRDRNNNFTVLDKEQVITPGWRGKILFGGSHTRKVVVETTNVPSGKRSHFYVHLEWYSSGGDVSDDAKADAVEDEEVTNDEAEAVEAEGEMSNSGEDLPGDTF